MLPAPRINDALHRLTFAAVWESPQESGSRAVGIRRFSRWNPCRIPLASESQGTPNRIWAKLCARLSLMSKKTISGHLSCSYLRSKAEAARKTAAPSRSRATDAGCA
jgi:hypothetical protein